MDNEIKDAEHLKRLASLEKRVWAAIDKEQTGDIANILVRTLVMVGLNYPDPPTFFKQTLAGLREYIRVQKESR